VGAPRAGAAAGHVPLEPVPPDEPQAETAAHGGRKISASDMVLPLRVRAALLAPVLTSEAQPAVRHVQKRENRMADVLCSLYIDVNVIELWLLQDSVQDEN